MKYLLFLSNLIAFFLFFSVVNGDDKFAVIVLFLIFAGFVLFLDFMAGLIYRALKGY